MGKALWDVRMFLKEMAELLGQLFEIVSQATEKNEL